MVIQMATSGLAEQAVPIAASQLAANPDDRLWLYALALALYNSHTPGAAEVARRVVAVAPDFEGGWRLLSVALEREGDGWGAADAAYQAIRLDPGEWANHVALADALIKVDPIANYHRALAEANEAVRLAPDESETHSAAGRVYYGGKQFNLAKKAFEAALKLNPDKVVDHYNLSLVAMVEDRTEDAARISSSILRQRPDVEPAKRPFLLLARRIWEEIMIMSFIALVVLMIMGGVMRASWKWHLPLGLLGAYAGWLGISVLFTVVKTPRESRKAVWATMVEQRWVVPYVMDIVVACVPVLASGVTGRYGAVVGVAGSMLGILALLLLARWQTNTYMAVMDRPENKNAQF